MSCLLTSSSSSSSSSYPSWDSLPADLTESVVEFLPCIFDRVHFGAVCKSWGDAAAAFHARPARCGVPSLPILTFRDPRKEGTAEEEDVSPITRCFYSLAEDKFYRLQLQVPCEFSNWRCFGSSHGWLSMVDLRFKPFLFNPFTGVRVDLPSLFTLTRLISKAETEKDCYNVIDERFCGQDVRDHFIFQLVLSASPLHPDCIIMATVTKYNLLAYTRPGYHSWVEVPTRYNNFEDIIYHDRKFYALAYDEKIGKLRKIVSIDFKPNIPPTVAMFAPKQCPHCCYPDRLYLVALPSGEIIHAVRYADHAEDKYETTSFEIHKSMGKEWVKVNDIGDCCLFLGLNQSMSLPASQVLGNYRANCIYFTDDLSYTYRGRKYGGHDFGIYDIEQQTVERFCHLDVQRVMPPLMWITPSV